MVTKKELQNKFEAICQERNALLVKINSNIPVTPEESNRFQQLAGMLQLMNWIEENKTVEDTRKKVLAVHDGLEYAFKQELGREYPNPEVAARIVRHKNQVKSELSVFNFILNIQNT
jgi:hypothetical protein